MQHRVLDRASAFARLGTGRQASPKLTAIISMRTKDFAFYRPRLSIRCQCDLSGVETILVDDGSPPVVGEEIKRFCLEKNLRYISCGSEEQPFSLSRARNAGLFAARGEWVFFEDADIVYPTSAFQSLMREAELLDHTPFNFLSVPTLYLGEDHSRRILEVGALTEDAARFLVTRFLMSSPINGPASNEFEHFVPASSLVLTKRTTAMSVGAFDEAFNSWGGEDRDFIYRLLHANPQLEKPPSFYATINTNMNRINEYKGWRALFRLHGDYLAAKGLYAFHLFHAKLEWKNLESTRANIDLAAQKAADIAKSNSVIPLARPDVPQDIILGINPHIANTQVYSALANPSVVPEDTSISPVAFAKSLAERAPSVVIIWNPYGVDWRLSVYRELQRLSVPTLVGERGALPWTLYFDDAISIDSTSYKEDRWNRPNTAEEDEAVAAYIEDLRFGDMALEKQSKRTGAAMLRYKLRVAHDTKILFAPLQLETDTVTVHFSETGRTYQDYIRALRDLSLRLPSGWVLAYKNHPLNLTKTEMASAICLDDVHINDALEVCDAVSLFNSGTGVIAMAFEKPAFYFGPSFYGIDGVNARFTSVQQMRSDLSDLFIVERAKVRCFFRYLIQDFYSFADWKAEAKRASHGKALVSKVSYLYYRSIRIPGRPKVVFPEPQSMSPDSVLMDRFRAVAKAAASQPQELPPHQAELSAGNWGATKRLVHRCSINVLDRSLSERDRQRLRHDPIDFFKKAMWWPNRCFGRLLLDKSQRPY